MKTIIIIICICIQDYLCAQTIEGQITIINGSFEGTPGWWQTIDGWSQCPGEPGGAGLMPFGTWIGMVLPAEQGATYLGFAYYPPQQDTFSEGTLIEDSIFQELTCPMVQGLTHSLSLYLYTINEGGVIGSYGHGVIRLYGGNQPCSTEQLLWQSPATTNQWQLYTAHFVPDSSWKYLIMKPYSLDSAETNMGVDATSNITVDSMPAGYCDTLTDISTLTQTTKLMRVLPNPASNKFSIIYRADEGNSMLQIFNNLGQQIAERKLTNAFGMEEFDSSKMEDGLYYIRWNDLNGKRLGYAKLIIAR